MNDTVLGGDPRRLITHCALYGLAAICEAAGHDDLRLSWTPGMAPRPRLSVDPSLIGPIVHEHATRCDWPEETIELYGKLRGLMSPRIAVINDDETWRSLQACRHRVIDGLAGADLDLRFIGALGEPSYWRYDRTGKERRQDEASSRLEMQARNQGSEFVRTRLRRIADAVRNRTPVQILDGLLGVSVTDEADGDSPSARSATGLGPLGPADNAVVWCALWGISQFPLALQTERAALTAGVVRGDDRVEHVVVPLWKGGLHPARLRTLLASDPLRKTAERIVRGQPLDGSVRTWLVVRGVTALVGFPVGVYGSASAPERRTGTGQVHSIGAGP